MGKLRWLDQHLAGYYLDQIDRDVIDRIAQIKKLEASAPTANRHLALIRSILRAARDEWDWIDKVPKVRLYNESQKRVRWLTPEDATRLMKELPEHLAVLMAFTLCTGLRQRNCSYLRWDQVDLERGTAWIFADQIKNKRNLAVPLNAQARKILVSQQGKHGTWCFPYQGSPVDRCSTKAWEKAKERAGIENFRWHDLRHTWASWHVQGGTTLHELQELGGWSSFLMVQRYAHLSSDHLKNAASRIEDVFGHDMDTMTHGRELRLVVSH